jgi:hypothetical protein
MLEFTSLAFESAIIKIYEQNHQRAIWLYSVVIKDMMQRLMNPILGFPNVILAIDYMSASDCALHSGRQT